MRASKDLTPIVGDILAEGETTGHAHRVSGGALYRDALGTLVLEATPATKIVHEEHHSFDVPVEAPAELYDVRCVVEIDHAAEAVREIAD